MISLNINELFIPQDKLDKIIENKKSLQGQDLKKRKMVAALAELYECANEARFFKFWSENQRARTAVECHACDGEGNFNNWLVEDGHLGEDCQYCLGTGIQEKPLLEEYVDVIHFMISIALEYDYKSHDYRKPISTDLNDRLLDITYLIASLRHVQKKVRHHQISLIFDYVISFGYQLGFTEEQVIKEYYRKNEINLRRQETGY